VKKGVGERLLKDTVKEVKKGVEFVKGKKVVELAILSLALFQIVLNVGVVLGPGYAEEVLGVDVRYASIIFAVPAGLGSLVGIYLMQRWQGKVLKREMVKKAILVSFFGFLGLTVGPWISFWALSGMKGQEGALVKPLSVVMSLSGVTAAIAFFLGIAFSLAFVPVMTVISEQTPEKYLGRTWGVANMFQFAVASLPLLFVGFLADRVGMIPLFLVFDTLVLIGYLYTRFRVFDKMFEE